MKKTTIFALVFICASTLLISCSDAEKIKKLTAQNKKLILEKKELETQVTVLSQRKDQAEEERRYLQEQKEFEEQQRINEQNAITFYFIVIRAQVKRFGYEDRSKSMIFTSDVNQISNYNDDIKYQLLDKMVKNVEAGQAYTNVSQREIFTFHTYKQASQAREKYVINSQ